MLHLGNARSFLLAWLDVRSVKGQILLRVEDLDGPRVRPDLIEQTIEDLKWLGLDWDEGPLIQSDREKRYLSVFDDLRNKDLVYPCICSRRDVESAAAAPHTGDEGPVYPGTCQDNRAEVEERIRHGNLSPCWRFRVPKERQVAWDDRFAGAQSFDLARDIGDFVVWKREGGPSYQLAVAVDDVDQGVDTVLRGDDLLPSVARQVLLWEFLGQAPPLFAHVPLVVGADGKRLAKRHGDTTLASLRGQGKSANEVVGLLAWWSGLATNLKPVQAHDLIEGFQLKNVPAKTIVWSGDWPEHEKTPTSGGG